MNSIKAKVIVPVLLILVLATSLIAVVMYRIGTQALTQSTSKVLALSASSVDRNLSLWLNGFYSEVSNLSQNENASKALASGFIAASAKKAMNDQFSAMLASQPAYKYLALVSVDELPVAGEAPAALVNGASRNAVQRFSLVLNQEVLSVFQLPVVDDGDLVGSVVGAVSLKDFSDQFIDTSNLSTNAAVRLFNQSGDLLIDTNSKLAKQASRPTGGANNQVFARTVIGDEEFLTLLVDNSETGIWVYVQVLASDVFGPIERTKVIATLVTLFVMLISAAVLFYIILNITKPIGIALEVFQDLATGEGDLSKRLRVRNKDEISQMSQSFNAFMTTLSGLIVGIRQRTEEVDRSVGTLKDVATDSLNVVSEQNTQTDRAAAAITELAASAAEVATLCAESNTNNRAVQTAIAEGVEFVAQQAKDVDHLANNLQEGKDRVDRLSSAVTSIGNVVEIINAIAEQTNLLALNAAIEAARAGEQGRGFAVVADEVRALAQKTQTSVTEIHQTVNQLQQEAKVVEQSFVTNLALVSNSVDHTEKSTQIFAGIHERVEVMADGNQQIVSSADEQSRVTEDIHQQVVAIADQASAATAAADRLNKEATQLEQVTAQLNQLVGRFKLD